MSVINEELMRQFESYTDEALIRRGNSGELTDAAQVQAFKRGDFALGDDFDTGEPSKL